MRALNFIYLCSTGSESKVYSQLGLGPERENLNFPGRLKLYVMIVIVQEGRYQGCGFRAGSGQVKRSTCSARVQKFVRIGEFVLIMGPILLEFGHVTTAVGLGLEPTKSGLVSSESSSLRIPILSFESLK